MGHNWSINKPPWRTWWRNCLGAGFGAATLPLLMVNPYSLRHRLARALPSDLKLRDPACSSATGTTPASVSAFCFGFGRSLLLLLPLMLPTSISHKCLLTHTYGHTS